MSALNFHHGIETVLIPDQPAPVKTAKSSVVGAVITAGKGPVNIPTIIAGSRRKAVEIFGEYHLDGFTGPEAIDAMLDSGQVTMILVNVCDPAVHNTDVEDEEITLDAKTHKAKTVKPHHTALSLESTAKVLKTFNDDGEIIIPDSLDVVAIQSADGETDYAITDDYTLADADGERTITRVGGGAIAAGAQILLTYDYAPGFDADVDFVHSADAGTIFRPVVGSHILPSSTLTVSYTYVDPTKVTSADIIGAVVAQAATGLQALVSSPSRVKLRPRILIAPRFTELYSAVNANGVISELNAAAKILGARVICDAPNLDRDSAITQASFFSGETDRVYMHYPYHVVRNPDVADAVIEQPAAARIAGHIAVVDNEFGFWNSPSNRLLAGVLSISKDLTYGLQDTETDTNLLNSLGVATTVFDSGFRLWGNRQTNLQHLSVQRIADMITEAVAVSHIWAVDRNITIGLVEQIVLSIKAYLRTLESIGALIPNPAPDQEQFNDVWADPELNTPDMVAEGNLFIDYRFNPPFPAEHIHFRAHITRKYISSIFVTADRNG